MTERKPNRGSSRKWCISWQWMARLIACTAVCAGLGWAILQESWAVVIGVVCISGFGTAVALKKWKACLAMFTFAVVSLTCLTISIWSVDGSLRVQASLGRYAAIGVAGALGAFIMARGRDKRLEALDATWLVISFLVVVSWLYSIAPSASIGRGIPLVAWSFCIYMLARATAAVDGGSLALLDALLSAVGLFLAAGAFLTLTKPELVLAGGRYTGPFRSASALGETCCIILPIAIWAARYHPRVMARAPYCLLVLIMSGSLLASQVRNAIASGLAGIIAILLIKRRRHLASEIPFFIAFSTVCITVVCFYYIPLTQTDFFRHYVSRRGTWETATGRFTLWEESLDRFEEHPLIGFGYGTESLAILSSDLPRYLRVRSRELSYYQHYVPFLKLDTVEGLNAHNTLLGVMVEMGVFGLAAFCAVLFFTFRGIMRVRPTTLSAQYQSLPPFIVGALVAGILNSMFESDLLSPGGIGFALFWLMVVISEAVRRRSRFAALGAGPRSSRPGNVAICHGLAAPASRQVKISSHVVDSTCK